MMTQQIQVLVVDDGMVWKEIRSKFGDSRFDIQIHRSAHEVADQIPSLRCNIAVVDMDSASQGASLIAMIREQMPRARCIGVIETSADAAQRAIALGCLRCITKPINVEAACAVIADVAASAGLLLISEQEMRIRLARLLRTRRLERGLTLTKMASEINLSKSQLSHIERGKSWPSVPTLKRISDVLEHSFAELFHAVEHGVDCAE